MPKSESGDAEGEANDMNHPNPNIANHVNSVPSLGQAFGAGAHFFTDPNVMMMTNTLAAAVAASAVQHITHAQQSASQAPTASRIAAPSTHNSGGNSPVPASLAAALGGAHGLGSSQATSVAGHLSSHVAHLFGAGKQVPMTFGLPKQNASISSSNTQSQIHQSLPSGSEGMTSSQNNYSSGGATRVVASQAAHAAAAMSSGAMSSALLPSMQTWSLEQLEQHVNLLHQMNQPIPQTVALLLAESRRKEEKRTAKRVANRKSACTSRARKKALVEEMTRTNARLRRQALILALLPDLVIAITVDGEITFCSAQVERVLRHPINDMIGANFRDLLVPASREVLRELIKELVNGENNGRVNRSPRSAQRPSKRRRSDQRHSNATNGNKNEEGNGNSNASGQGSSQSGGDASAAAVVSDQSFPLSVVQVESKQVGRVTADIENSDTSTSNEGGKPKAIPSLTNSTTLSRSPTASSSGEDDGTGKSRRRSQRAESSSKAKRLPSSDDSSSLSSEAKNLRQANENLERNVRWHNEKMMGKTIKAKSKDGHTDDVTGAFVTANNATARLSSLQHVPEPEPVLPKHKVARYENGGDQSSSEDSLLAGVEEKKKGKRGGENASDDSGYRESNDSREETSSSGSESSNSNGRRKKTLSPTCSICLIRDDLTTVWCEVTSSVRTLTFEEENPDGQPQPQPGKVARPGSTPPPSDPTPAKGEVKELLLCLRPVRDGDKKVEESLRFTPPIQQETTPSGDTIQSKIFPTGEVVPPSMAEQNKIDSSNISQNNAGLARAVTSNDSGYVNDATVETGRSSKRPPKKRPMQSKEDTSDDFSPSPNKRRKGTPQDDSIDTQAATDTEKSVVESLMLMSNKSQ